MCACARLCVCVCVGYIFLRVFREKRSSDWTKGKGNMVAYRLGLVLVGVRQQGFEMNERRDGRKGRNVSQKQQGWKDSRQITWL